jgi:broad specificity phosphatase PhoE
MTSPARREVYLVRHGETAWSISGQHTGRTDLALTAHGEEQARGLVARLRGLSFDQVFTSPLRRALRTCELAGFGGCATLDPELLEWDYGDYEGRTLAQIHQVRPGWDLFRDGCPGGESVAQISARVDRVISRLRALGGRVLLFSSGHVLRVLAARWVEATAERVAGWSSIPLAFVCWATTMTVRTVSYNCGTMPGARSARVGVQRAAITQEE